MTQLQHRDLLSIQEARELAERAYEASLELKSFTQEQADSICARMAEAGFKEAERLAKIAVEETGFGKWEDKKTKNEFATRNLWEYIKDMKTAGFIDPPGAVRRVAEPMGVVAGIIPSTNPTSTALYKAIISLKARNSIVMSPHPSAAKCIIEASEVVKKAAIAAGAPADSILCMTVADLQGTHELMSHPKVAVILATGGTGLVRAAYSAGKPAYGVGPGNCPTFIERTADPEKAVKDIIVSKTFDNGTVCSSEQSIIVDRPLDSRVRELLVEGKAYFCSEDEIRKLEDLMIIPRGLNPKVVGQQASKIAQMAGFEVPAETSILVVEIGGVGPEYPLSIEKISPVICYYVAEGWEAGCELCLKLIHHGGIGHSLSIHTQDNEIVERFALEKPVMRVLVNTPATQGAIGLSTGLAPALTLGPGTWGGSITADNVTPMHLLNIKRLAYETKPINPGSKDIFQNSTKSKWRYDDEYRYRPETEIAGNTPKIEVSRAKTVSSVIPGAAKETVAKMISPDKTYGEGISEAQVSEIIRRFRGE